MLEAQPPCMQCLTVELDRTQFLAAVDVPRFADQHVPTEPRLKADLIALARVKPHFEQRGVTKRFEDAILARRERGSGIVRMRSLLDQVARIPDEVIAP